MTHAFLGFLLAIAARTAIVAICLTIGLRVLGKRQLAQINVYDLALIMALANAVQNAMTHGSGNLSVGFVSAGTLLIFGWLMARLFVRSNRLYEHIVGTPTLMISDGELIPDNMRREHITEEQVMTALRQHGLTDPADVKLAVLEVDGSLSVVPQEAPPSKRNKRKR